MPGNADYFNEGKRKRKPKYKNQSFTNFEGKWDSILEWRRWCLLKSYEDDGTIKDLQRQVNFELIPNQLIDGRVVERSVDYTADFTYMKDEKLIVEDTKGFKTKDYVIKRKLMLYIHGIKIKEIR